MNRNQKKGCGLYLILVLLLAFVADTRAQSFVYKNNDLLLGFRKNGVYQENNELVVDIGQASNYVNAAIGSIIPVTNFSLAQLTPGTFSSLNNLSWSVTGWYTGTSYPGYPTYTLWVTVPRANINVRSTPATRLDRSTQQTTRSEIVSIFANASFISSDLATSNDFNNVYLVREGISAYPSHILSVFMGGIADNTVGTLHDAWPEGNLEVTTGSSFSSSVRSDLYEVQPTNDQNGNPIVDPHTGTNGFAYYVGYFELNSQGTMNFIREASNPPSPLISIVRSGSTSTISFASANGSSYTLYYTNATGLAAPLSSWPSLPSTISGDGNNKSFIDTTADSYRVYRVGVQ